MVTPVDVTLPAAVDNQPIVQLRIMTADAAGSDEWVGIDDIVVELDTAPRPPAITARLGHAEPGGAGPDAGDRCAGRAGRQSAERDARRHRRCHRGRRRGQISRCSTTAWRPTPSPVTASSPARWSSRPPRLGATNIPLEVVDDLGRSGGGTLVVEVIAPVQQLAIHDIQGAGISSPYVGQTVRTTGIVTARRSNGLYVQTPDELVDGDTSTSEGVFVFTSSAAAGGGGRRRGRHRHRHRGRVRVPGRSGDYRADRAGHCRDPDRSAAAAPITLTTAVTDPNGGLFQLEHLEGMRVLAPSLTVIAPSDGQVDEVNGTGTVGGLFFAVLSGTPRPVREPGIEALDPVPPCAAGSGCAIPIFDENPERLRILSNGLTGVQPPW